MNTQTMVHTSYPGGLRLIERLYNDKLLDSAYITLRPPFTACQARDNGIAKVPTAMCFTIEIGSLPPPKRESLIPLWNALIAGGAKVTVKEDNKGYAMGRDGQFTEEWELDDGMC